MRALSPAAKLVAQAARTVRCCSSTWGKARFSFLSSAPLRQGFKFSELVRGCIKTLVGENMLIAHRAENEPAKN